jgi:hypothetical protein
VRPVAIGTDAGHVLETARASVEPPSRAGGNDRVIFAMFVAPGFIWLRHSCDLTLEEGESRLYRLCAVSTELANPRLQRPELRAAR